MTTENQLPKTTSTPQGYRYYDTPERPHVHTWNDQPLMGASSVGSVLETPLAWWASSMAVGNMGWMFQKKKVGNRYVFNTDEKRLAVAALHLMRIRSMTAEQYLALLDESYRAHNQVKEDKAESGTIRHAFLEEYIKPCIAHFDGVPQQYKGNADVEVFASWARKNIRRFLWSEINCYSLTYWTGGIADVGWTDMENRTIAGDFKSSKEAYFKHWIQIAGYDLMLAKNGGFTADGKKIFTMPGAVQGYCVIPFGQLTDPFGDHKLNPEFIYNVDDFRAAFPQVVALYKLKKSYDSFQ